MRRVDGLECLAFCLWLPERQASARMVGTLEAGGTFLEEAGLVFWEHDTYRVLNLHNNSSYGSAPLTRLCRA